LSGENDVTRLAVVEPVEVKTCVDAVKRICAGFRERLAGVCWRYLCTPAKGRGNPIEGMRERGKSVSGFHVRSPNDGNEIGAMRRFGFRKDLAVLAFLYLTVLGLYGSHLSAPRFGMTSHLSMTVRRPPSFITSGIRTHLVSIGHWRHRSWPWSR